MTHSRENGGLDSQPPVTPGFPRLNHTMLQAGAKGTDNDRNGDKDGMVVVITSEHKQLHGYKRYKNEAAGKGKEQPLCGSALQHIAGQPCELARSEPTP